jgi:hypothetical protein
VSSLDATILLIYLWHHCGIIMEFLWISWNFIGALVYFLYSLALWSIFCTFTLVYVLYLHGSAAWHGDCLAMDLQWSICCTLMDSSSWNGELWQWASDYSPILRLWNWSPGSCYFGGHFYFVVVYAGQSGLFGLAWFMLEFLEPHSSPSGLCGSI